MKGHFQGFFDLKFLLDINIQWQIIFEKGAKTRPTLATWRRLESLNRIVVPRQILIMNLSCAI